MADYADIDAALTSHAQSVRRGRSNSHNSGSHSKGHKATKRTRKGGQSRLKGHRQRDNEASSEFFKRPSRGRDAVPSRELLGLGKPRPHKTPFASVGVFGDIRKFFDELRTDLDTVHLAANNYYPAGLDVNLEDLQYSGDNNARNYKALKTESEKRRQARMRKFMIMAEPPSHKNPYDPSLLWTGFG